MIHDPSERESLRLVARNLYNEHCSNDALQEAEATGWLPELWEAQDRVGFADVSVSEDLGGAGGEAADALTILQEAGKCGAPVPIAEAGMLAGWLITQGDLQLPKGVRTVAPPSWQERFVLDKGKLSGCARNVPWGARADWVVILVPTAQEQIIVILRGPSHPDSKGVRVESSVNLAGEPRDVLYFDEVVPAQSCIAPLNVSLEALHRRGALTRISLMTGALQAMAAMTVTYTSQREQFGRPVRAFQAVQQHLVTVQQQSSIAAAALDGATAAIQFGEATFEIAAAKLLANQAARTATRAAHQAHGAMGMTQEYPLHYLSRRLWSWRNEYGNENYWAARLGGAIIDAGPGKLYPAITSGSAVVRV